MASGFIRWSTISKYLGNFPDGKTNNHKLSFHVIQLQLSLSNYVPEQILSVQFLQSTLTESHFPESPLSSSQSTTPSSKFSTMEMEKVVAEKLDGWSSKCSSTLVQCWRNWTIVKFGRFVTELRTIGPLSILPQFRHHFTIGCHPLSPSPPAQASIPPQSCSHLVSLVFANLQNLNCKTKRILIQ